MKLSYNDNPSHIDYGILERFASSTLPRIGARLVAKNSMHSSTPLVYHRARANNTECY